MTASFSALVRESLELEDIDIDIDIDVGGVGGTLAGNALSLAGIRATLSQVLTADAFPGMIDRASEWTVGVQSTLDEFGVPWQVTQLGARSEISFRATVSADGAEHHRRRCRAAHRRVPRGGSEPPRLTPDYSPSSR
jgi:glutamate-1-semialdehyde 2,1-aminomutase